MRWMVLGDLLHRGELFYFAEVFYFAGGEGMLLVKCLPISFCVE